MGSEDTRLWEDAMVSLRDENKKLKEVNTELRQQNADLKDYIKHVHNEITHFMQYNAIKKEL
jgi:cell division protein FtsB